MRCSPPISITRCPSSWDVRCLDVRDGLKPVHRRILYAMYEDGLTSDKPLQKVGDDASATCSGRIPSARRRSVSTTRWCVWRRIFPCAIPLIDGHGNFGSIDGDPPAAYRYTESAHVASLRRRCCDDIDKDTVDFEPELRRQSRRSRGCCPSRFPNLLVNGSIGHRRRHGDQYPAAQPPRGHRRDASCILDNPEAEPWADLMEHIKGPDFPTRRHHHGPQRHPRRPMPRAAARSSSVPAPTSRSSARTGRAIDRRNRAALSGQQGEMLISSIADQVQGQAARRASPIPARRDRPRRYAYCRSN